jgi:hypothetical protein
MAREDARAAAERLAAAAAAGNLALVLVDILPEALQQFMQANPGAGGPLAAVPTVERFWVEDAGGSDDAPIFRVTFEGPAGQAVLEATWGEVAGQWKVTRLQLVGLERRQQS